MSNPSYEPSADNRAMAKALRDMYVALQQEGFTEREAFSIVGEVIRNAMGTGGGVL